jgi:hypothetical protein
MSRMTDGERLAWLEAEAEKAYDQMYDARRSRDADDLYRDAKDFLYDAIALATELGLAADSERLSARLAHIKAVYRSQFFQ